MNTQGNSRGMRNRAVLTLIFIVMGLGLNGCGRLRGLGARALGRVGNLGQGRGGGGGAAAQRLTGNNKGDLGKAVGASPEVVAGINAGIERGLTGKGVTVASQNGPLGAIRQLTPNDQPRNVIPVLPQAAGTDFPLFARPAKSLLPMSDAAKAGILNSVKVGPGT